MYLNRELCASIKKDREARRKLLRAKIRRIKRVKTYLSKELDSANESQIMFEDELKQIKNR